MRSKLKDYAEPVERLESGARVIEVIEALVRSGSYAAVIEGRPPVYLTVENLAAALLKCKGLSTLLFSPPPPSPQRLVSGDENVARVLTTVKEKYVFVTEGGEVSGVLTPRAAFRAVSAAARLSDVGRELTESAVAVLWPHTTVKGALRRMLRAKSAFAVVQRGGRVRGVVGIHALLAPLTDPEVLSKVDAGHDDYYFYASVVNIPCNNRSVVPRSQLTRGRLVEVLSEHGNLVVTHQGYMDRFFDDFRVAAYARRLARRMLRR